MNSSNIYDRTMFKNEFKKIYNATEYDFPLNDNLLSNKIAKWKLFSDRFKNTTVLNNLYDYNQSSILEIHRYRITQTISLLSSDGTTVDLSFRACICLTIRMYLIMC